MTLLTNESTEQFDYAALDQETRIVVQQRTRELRDEQKVFERSMQQTVESAWRIGERLLDVKRQLAHGQFLDWLALEFPHWGERSAQNFMAVASQFKSATVADLKMGLKALYLLAAPSTPEEARTEAVERARAGEVITFPSSKAIVASHKPSSTPAHDIDEGQIVYFKGLRCRILIVNGDKVLLKSEINGQRQSGVRISELQTEAAYQAAQQRSASASHSVSSSPFERMRERQQEATADPTTQAPQAQVQPAHQFAARELALDLPGHVVEIHQVDGAQIIARDPQNNFHAYLPTGLTYIDESLGGAGLTHDQVIEVRAFAALELSEWNERQDASANADTEEETRPADDEPTPPKPGSGEALKDELHRAGLTSVFKVVRHKEGDAYTAAFDSSVRHSNATASLAARTYAEQLQLAGYLVENAGVDIDKGLAFNGYPVPMVRFKPNDSDEWYTPADVIAVVRAFLDGIDLDPASCEAAQRTVQARVYYTRQQDGLSQPWRGHVWLNSPYSFPAVEQFTSKLIAEHEAGAVSEAVCVVNNRTDADWFQQLLQHSACICFVSGRINFEHPRREANGNRQGQVFFYLGENVEGFMSAFAHFGTILVGANEQTYLGA